MVVSGYLDAFSDHKESKRSCWLCATSPAAYFVSAPVRWAAGRGDAMPIPGNYDDLERSVERMMKIQRDADGRAIGQMGYGASISTSTPPTSCNATAQALASGIRTRLSDP